MSEESLQIVCLDDQHEVLELLSDIFTARGRKVYTFTRGEDVLAHLKTQSRAVSAVLIDLDLGPQQPDGLFFLREIRAEHPDLPAVILTGKGSVEAAVAAVQAGATDFVEKDYYLEDKLELSVEKIDRLWAVARQRDALEETNRDLRAEMSRMQADMRARHAIVGDDPKLKAVMEKVFRVAPLPRPVLITGERGTGKELVAHAIHEASNRCDKPFVVMNCAAVPETLLESELFGHEKGAFTGATQRKLGKFELADEGTLFLDEIGNMSTDFQVKILRVLEYQRFCRVAGSQELNVDVRVIAATNADLRRAIAEGAFRADLYDRLTFEVIELPPLRDRKSDIARLAERFIERFSAEVGGLRCREIGEDALAVLVGYDFPGNVRELKNVVERAAYAAEGDTLRARDVQRALPSENASIAPVDDSTLAFTDRIENYEKKLLLDALTARSWSQKDAANDLGLTYDQFRHMYRKYNLSRERP
jgi:DNA-binding NtrC family response regulator